MNATPKIHVPTPYRHSTFVGSIGVARRDITPPPGIYNRNWGAAKHDVADSIHRPLTLTAMTITSSSAAGAPTGGLGAAQYRTPVANSNQVSPTDELVLLDTDLGWWKTPQTFTRFIEALLQRLSLQKPQLIFALSHTHSGPPLMDPDDSLPGAAILSTWKQKLLEDAVSAVTEARQTRFDARLDWKMGRCGLASNRDLPDPDSSQERIITGFNPDIAADDALLLGRVTDSTGRIRATLVNYACHPTTLAWDNRAISPDYVGAMRQIIQTQTQAPSLFLLGACGELAPRLQYSGDPNVADRHGFELGFAAMSVLAGMEPPGAALVYTHTVESGAPLAVWDHRPSSTSNAASSALSAYQLDAVLPLKQWPSADELEKQRAECTDRAIEERLRRKRDIRRGIGDGSAYRLPIYAWRMGDAVLVGTSAEAYSVVQLELRRRFPDHAIICMNLINGSIGYLPPAHLYDKNLYTVWQTPFDVRSHEIVLQTMIKAIQHVLQA